MNDEDLLELDMTKKAESTRWRIVRNRWNLAYTLIKNPSLVKYRKSQSENEDSEESEETKSIPGEEAKRKEALECEEIIEVTPVVHV